jgi:hypothetical protein
MTKGTEFSGHNLEQEEGHEMRLQRIYSDAAKAAGIILVYGAKPTGYGLDSPGIESRWGRDFSHTSRPALRPTQPPIQRIPSLSRG